MRQYWPINLVDSYLRRRQAPKLEIYWLTRRLKNIRQQNSCGRQCCTDLETAGRYGEEDGDMPGMLHQSELDPESMVRQNGEERVYHHAKQ